MEENRIIICDFDGTLAMADIGNAIMERFAPPEWLEWENLWRQGKISTQENMETQFNMLKVSAADLIEWVRRQPLRPGCKEFIQECRARSIPFYLVSDGLDFYIDPVLAANGLSELTCFANSTRQDENGRWHIEPLYQNHECKLHGCCKCNVMDQLDPGHRATRVYIGDSYSDLCPSRQADIIFARHVLAENCSRLGIPFHEFETFNDIMSVLWGCEAASAKYRPHTGRDFGRSGNP